MERKQQDGNQSTIERYEEAVGIEAMMAKDESVPYHHIERHITKADGTYMVPPRGCRKPNKVPGVVLIFRPSNGGPTYLPAQPRTIYGNFSGDPVIFFRIFAVPT